MFELEEAHDAGSTVIVKEALANGRLVHEADASPRSPYVPDRRHARRPRPGVPTERTWVDAVLSGAATSGRLEGDVSALTVPLTAEGTDDFGGLPATAEPAPAYWQRSAGLP